MADPNGHTAPPKVLMDDSSEDFPLTIDMASLSDEQIRRYTFVDVREDNERIIKPCREIEHEHFPLSQFQPDGLREGKSGFSCDPGRRYIFFCAKGQRSLMLAQYLREQGMPNVSSLNGGIDAIKKHFRNQ